ncbi:MAG: hypothetical protein OEL76_08195 [Siculibacillus sp.]|nr:hypothetical protein [Siculibacillus sp.]
MINLLAVARRALRRAPRPAVDRGMWESSTCATLRRHWIDPLNRE